MMNNVAVARNVRSALRGPRETRRENERRAWRGMTAPRLRTFVRAVDGAGRPEALGDGSQARPNGLLNVRRVHSLAPACRSDGDMVF